MAFANRSLAEHLLRGAIGFATMIVAVNVADRHPWSSLLLDILALLAFRGCPVCWTTGLLETLALRVLRRYEKPGP